MATVIAEGAPPRTRATRSRIYVGLALLICAIVAAGFGRSFFGTFVGGAVHPWIIHVHAAVYVGWLVLLVAQAVLAARGRIAQHRRLGARSGDRRPHCAAARRARGIAAARRRRAGWRIGWGARRR